jgi:hypothetical protein
MRRVDSKKNSCYDEGPFLGYEKTRRHRMSDYFPQADGALQTWIVQFLAGIKANLTALGLTQAQLAAAEAAALQWNTDSQAHEDAKAKVHAASKQENKSHDELEQVVRTIVHAINGAPGVDNALRAKAYLPPHDETPTPIGPPTTKPLVRTEVKGHYTLLLHVADETTPKRAAKPYGVRGCRIFRFIGDPAPADPASFIFLNTTGRTPYVDIHNPADAGKSVHYVLCWESTKHEQGPWSDVTSAKIPS